LALEAIGREIKKMGTLATLMDITNSDLYKIPILLRARTEIAGNLFWPNDPPKPKAEAESSDSDDSSDSDESEGKEKKPSQSTGGEKTGDVKKTGDSSEAPRASIGYIGESESDGSIDLNDYDDDDDDANYSSFLKTVNSSRNGTTQPLHREDSKIPAGMVVPASISDTTKQQFDDFVEDKTPSPGESDDGGDGDDDDDDINDEDYM